MHRDLGSVLIFEFHFLKHFSFSYSLQFGPLVESKGELFTSQYITSKQILKNYVCGFPIIDEHGGGLDYAPPLREQFCFYLVSDSSVDTNVPLELWSTHTYV